MTTYTIYFVRHDTWNPGDKFDFEYKVEAVDEEIAKKEAISIFNRDNPDEDLTDYTYGIA